MHKTLYLFVWIIKKSKALSALSLRLTKLTGKSKYRIHPKHLIKIEKPWYLSSIKKTDKVLDLGCHNGQHTLKTSQFCKSIKGLDKSLDQLKIAKDSTKDKGVKNATFSRHNLEKKLPIKANYFDKILCLDVLEHIVHRKQLLSEIKRVLKPAGLAFIAIPNTATTWKKLQKKVGLNYYSDPDHKIEYTKKQIETVLDAAGFNVLALKPVVFDTPWVGFFDLLGGLSLKAYTTITKIKKHKVINNLNESTGFRIIIKHKTK